jgi:SSS family solute:Na+ symporter
MPAIVIMPGIIYLALHNTIPGFDLPKNANGDTDYNMVMPLMLQKLYPSGLLGLGITALSASFMSGMAGNVTAFNTVFAFDIYQAHINRNASGKHYLYVGKATTVAGFLISVATAYVAREFNSIMDLLQLVFFFVNAPLFATFFLGMFSRRTTGHGAFCGLVSGSIAAAAVHGLTTAEGKGGWITSCYTFYSGTGQAFTIASIAFAMFFIVTQLVSISTTPKTEKELVGLVYSLTPRQKDERKSWYKNPLRLGMIVLVVTVLLDVIFY